MANYIDDYSDLEDFGGSEEKIKAYQKKYVSYFKDCKSVLDVGCGRGFFLDLLKEEKITCVGLDVQDQALQICRDNGHDVIKTDLFKFLEKEQEMFDGIFCSHVIEHMMPDELLDFIVKAKGALKKDGTLVLITPNFHDLHVIAERFWLAMDHKRPYPLALLVKILKEHGFELCVAGEDMEQKPNYSIFQYPIYWMRKKIFGDYWGRGDNYVVVRKV